MTVVERWFGGQFNDLHPKLQQLHQAGGVITGEVDIAFGRGLAGWIGKRLAKKMGFPRTGRHTLTVSISHQDDHLRWSRSFNSGQEVVSFFKPFGTIEEGFWTEKTGPLEMRLTVDIIEGGWHWRCLRIAWFGVRLPQWLLPQTTAYKTIEGEGYRFAVVLAYPGLGPLVSYQGTLHE